MAIVRNFYFASLLYIHILASSVWFGLMTVYLNLFFGAAQLKLDEEFWTRPDDQFVFNDHVSVLQYKTSD